MTYLDSSVALAHLLAEDRVPPAELWEEPLVSSRLIHYEVWNRIHEYGLTASHGEAARVLLARLALLEMTPYVLARALEPFPGRVRTLDALHLASVEFLRDRGQQIRIATYDTRMRDAAKTLGCPIYPLAEEDQD